MALGGGTFTAQNKVLPGTYINFVNAAKASGVISDRGVVAMPVTLKWGNDSDIFEVTADDFYKHSLKIFGYAYTADEMKDMRELFAHCVKAYLCRVNVGVKAECTYATAKYSGSRGNDLNIVITANENSTQGTPLYDVETLLGTVRVDLQTGVSAMSGLNDNDYVDFKDSATIALTAGTSLTGGADGTADGENYQTFLDKAEAYSFNILALASTDATLKALFSNYTKRLRDEQGVKFQCVLYKYTTADHEGIISVENKLSGENGTESAGLTYWAAGAEAACAVNKSCTNMLYDGELLIDVDYTQSSLEAAINAGKLILHKVGKDIRVLTDINTLTTTTDTKGVDFKSNMTVRIIDAIANGTAALFNAKYLGRIPNNDVGRTSLWGDLLAMHRELEKLGAIESFDSEFLTVEEGDTKTSVVVSDCISAVNAMEKLYMTVIVE